MLPESPEQKLSAIARQLEDHEFSLSGQLVADIAITETAILDGKYSLIVDALLLDD